MSASDPDRDPELTISDRYVYRLIDEDAPLTRQELLAKTEVAEATVDRALERLEERGYIAKTRKNGDLREVVLMLRTALTSNHQQR